MKYFNTYVCAFVGVNKKQYTMHGMYIKTGKNNFRFCVSVLQIASHQCTRICTILFLLS